MLQQQQLQREVIYHATCPSRWTNKTTVSIHSHHSQFVPSAALFISSRSSSSLRSVRKIKRTSRARQLRCSSWEVQRPCVLTDSLALLCKTFPTRLLSAKPLAVVEADAGPPAARRSSCLGSPAPARRSGRVGRPPTTMKQLISVLTRA